MTGRDVQVGAEIESWCTRCKLDLNHTVVAKLEGVVKRVQCLTCGGQHNYSGPKARKASRSGQPAVRARARKAVPVPEGPLRPYAVGERFAEAQWLVHPLYGPGRVVQTRGDKIDVEFANGSKTLVNGRAPVR